MTQSTKLQNHNTRAHALLAASSASRWINCTPSARLEDEYGERESTQYAREGTLAHELSELYLRRDALGEINDSVFNSRLEEIMSNELFNEEMLDVIPLYTDYCQSQFIEAKTIGSLAEMRVEQKLDLTGYIPEGFGTADCVIVRDNVLEVIDLKYGKGVPVHADWNKQLMTYGLGALDIFDALYDINEVKLTIVQPRLNNISTFIISVSELKDWGNNELKPKAQQAFNGTGELAPGEWCRFCSVRNVCKKLYEKQLEIAKYEFRNAQLLSDDEIADVIRKIPTFIEWANSITSYAEEKAIKENKIWPNLKLVEGVSRRKWIDEEQAANIILSNIPEISEEQIYNTKLKSITDIEKIIGKKNFEAKLSSAVIKPQGRPILVPIEDKRPALGIEQAVADFSE